MNSLNDKVTFTLAAFCACSFILLIAVYCLPLDEESTLRYYALLLFTISLAAHLSYGCIKDHGGPPKEWIIKGFGVIAVVSCMVFIFQGERIYADDDSGYQLEDVPYARPTFESKAVAAVSVFGRCVIGLLIGVAARSITLRAESGKTQDTRN